MAMTDLLFKLAVEGNAQARGELDLFNNSLDTVNGYVDKAKNALIGLASIAGAMKFVDMIQGSIASAAALDGIAKQAGISSEALSGLTRVGKLSGTGAEDIADSLNKMQRALQASNEETGKVGDALQRLGIDFNTFKGMSPDQQMVAVAKAMEEFADGTGKSQVAMELFGKTGAKQLEFLRDLALTEELHAKFTDEQIAQAEDYEKDLIRLTASSQAWKDHLAMGMLPALQETAKAFLDVMNNSGGLKDEIAKLSADGSIADWTRTAVTGLSYVLDAFSGLSAVAKSAVAILGAAGSASVAAFMALDEAAKGNFSSAMNTLKGGWEQQKTILSALGTELDAVWGQQTFGSKMRDAIANVQAHGTAQEVAKPQIAGTTKALESQTKALEDAAAEQQKLTDAGYAFLDKAAAMTLELEAQTKQTEKLTPAQKLLIQVQEALSNGEVTMLPNIKAGTLAYLDRAIAAEKNIDLSKELKKTREDETKAQEAGITVIQNQTTAMQGENDKMREQIMALALGKEGYAAYTIDKMLALATTKEMDAALLEETDDMGLASAELRTQATLLRQRAGLAAEGIVVKEAVDARNAWEHTTKSIGDGLSSALTDALMNGRSLWDAFKNYLINTILDGMIKNALSSVIQAGLSSLSGGLSTALSAFGASVNSMTGGALSSIGSAVSSGVSSIANAVGISTTPVSSAGVSSVGSLFVGGGAASTGATSTAVVGGGAGAATGVDLGLLGSGGAATGTAGAGLSSLALLGTVAGMAAGVYIAGSLVSSLTGIGDVGHTTWQPTGRTGTTNTNGLAYTYSQQVNDAGQIGYAVTDPNGMSFWSESPDPTTIAFNAASATASVNAQGTSGGGFANGGDFMGGIRLVGERGPELELTGPSRIFDAQTTASMLRSGGASGPELADELRQLREEVRGLRSSVERGNEHASRTANAINGQQGVPLLVQMVPV